MGSVLAPALALLLATAHAAGQSAPLVRLQGWVGRARSLPRTVDEEREEELRAILGELRLADADPSALTLGLIGLASLGRELGNDPGGAAAEKPPAPLLASARLGRKELEDELARGGAECATRLARDVLDRTRRRPPEERVLAAELLADAHAPETLALLCAAAREDDRDLALAARTALCGWDEPRVHLFFLEELAHHAPLTRLAGEHFQRTRASLGDAALTELARHVAQRYLSDDWREAAGARELGRALDTPRLVPILIEALATWNRRGENGKGSKRIRAEILAELRRISGRAIGPVPENWSAWWEGVQSGRNALPEELAAAGIESSTASFFGLHAFTDRVLFVVDRSGSMRTALATGEHSRHDEAIEQMLRFLRQSGEDTRFSVAMFNAKGYAWRSRLQPASDGNLELARHWLEGNPPEGSTYLFEGLRTGLSLDSHGRIPLERCEADTVIVLCDGATAEGPGWVARWLAEENEGAQLVFHCVLIGGEGDGTLEALAKGSGGEFVHVQS